MKGEIFAVKHFAVHDGDGIRTTLFLKGCSLNCLWCHNPEGKHRGPQVGFYDTRCIQCGECVSVCKGGAHQTSDGHHRFERGNCVGCGLCESVCVREALSFYGRMVTPKEILPELLADRMFYRASGGVTLSGGECLCQPAFCAELLRLLKMEGINTAVDTCGQVPWSAFEQVLPYTDTFLFDVKAADSELHKRLTGCGNDLILANLQKLNNTGIPIEVRIPYIPQHNDGEMDAIAALLKPLHSIKTVQVLGYHSYASEKYLSLDMEDTMPKVDMPTKTEIAMVQRCIDEIWIKGSNEK